MAPRSHEERRENKTLSMKQQRQNRLRWQGRLLKAASLERIALRRSEAGRWLQRQRRKYRNGELATWKIQLLDEHIPDWLTDWDDVWIQRLDLAVLYYHREGRLPPNKRSTEGTWLSKQRERRVAGTLAPHRRRTLDRMLPGWDVTGETARIEREARWQEHFDELVTYAAENDGLPATSIPLGKWLSSQRRYATAEHAAVLDRAVPGWRGNAAPPAPRPQKNSRSDAAVYQQELDAHFQSRVDQVAAYAVSFELEPCPIGDSLADWIRRQAKKLDPDGERAIRLDGVHPQWRQMPTWWRDHRREQRLSKG